MDNNTKDKILTYISTIGIIKPADIYANFAINRQMVHRHLKSLLDSGQIKKIGHAPKVFYSPANENDKTHSIEFNLELKQVIEEQFLFIEPTGVELSGISGFVLWCAKRGFDTQKKAKEFSKIIQKYQKIKKNGLLDATSKINKTFAKNTCVDKVFYFDFYAVEVFGKTKTGQQLLYAKQGQNRVKIKKIIATIKPYINKLISSENIDSVIFVPPTVPRILQFMHLFRLELALSLPEIKVVKVFADIRVAQKTLKKLTDRIDNANYSFVVEGNVIFNKTLIIDDALGSGASINQIACKLKQKKCTKIALGFAITGSLNDFEVISEV